MRHPTMTPTADPTMLATRVVDNIICALREEVKHENYPNVTVRRLEKVSKILLLLCAQATHEYNRCCC